MTFRLKKILVDKVYPHILDKRAVLPHLRYTHYTHKNNENNIIRSSTKNLQSEHLSKQSLHTSFDSIQLSLDRETVIKNILTNFTTENMSSERGVQKIVIDFSSPNIAKPFHAGHLRSTIIGNFIANIHKYFNDKVMKINYLGDWGTQFGLLQYGMQQNNIDIDTLKDNPIRLLYETYVKANKLSATDENIQRLARKYFSDIEQGTADLGKWKVIRKVTVDELSKIYQRLGIQFDDYHWESDYNGEAIKDVISLLEKENILRIDSDGKKVATVNNRDVTLLKSDNSTLYLSRDVAALLDRYERYGFDKMLYVVDNSQTDHFASVIDIVRRINKKCAEGCEHIKFGRIKGMSTRKGNVVFLGDILEEAKQKMYYKQQISKNTRSNAMNEETCDRLGTTAVIINDLKQRRQKDYVFDWDRALQSEGDSGIKLQYLHCRLWSLEQNCGVKIPSECDPGYLTEEVIGDVVVELAKFEDILYRSLVEHEACVLVNYLFRLAKHVNRMFNELKVKNVESNLAEQRLLVFHRARLVVKTGLEILGVKPLKEM
ncbi:probable arginine--tRNA ligase, mitochondrial [Amyelois transitella]|uniref:probable arginine--tRNA ligase, mitochondrial n=1 Tax=Amyelois transitella TaxID=680683 RepID=UPI00298FC903|nr:probable arginine--tRNA ligase, mitochondrial [Amyelois transitella]